MKKILLAVLTLTLLALAFSGCELIDKMGGGADKEPHVHTGGTATCKNPAACTECGEFYGEKRMSHDYNDATCTVAKTCRDCGVTFGLPLGHSYSDATCQTPKTCTVCGEVIGDTMPHRFVPATCQTPKTCSICGISEGELGGHSYSAPTCDTPATCKVCGNTTGEPEHSFNEYYSYNDNAHWIACAYCNAKKNEGTHEGGEATTTSRAECDVCGARYGEEQEVTVNWKISALTPIDNSTICLANQKLKTWYETFDYRTTDTNGYMTGEDIFYPDTATFKWTVGEAADYYKVYISESKSMFKSQCYLTVECELTVEHLYVGRDYYWFVDAVYDGYTVRSGVFTFSTESTPRTVYIEGVSNSRDIGGYTTIDGKVIKQGMIYRSAKLDDITELGKYTLVNILGVKTDLDLRGDRKIDENGNPYMQTNNATHPLEALNHITIAAPWYATGDNGIWHDDFNKQEFAKSIKVFADINNYPIVFHCSLGRDRTGTLAMVLGGLLGLDEQTLMMEYELSAFSYWGAYGGNFNTSLRNSIHDTYLYISNNYEGDTFSEKVEDFLLEIGVTAEEIASIKTIMLEEVE